MGVDVFLNGGDVLCRRRLFLSGQIVRISVWGGLQISLIALKYKEGSQSWVNSGVDTQSLVFWLDYYSLFSTRSRDENKKYIPKIDLC